MLVTHKINIAFLIFKYIIALRQSFRKVYNSGISETAGVAQTPKLRQATWRISLIQFFFNYIDSLFFLLSNQFFKFFSLFYSFFRFLLVGKCHQSHNSPVKKLSKSEKRRSSRIRLLASKTRKEIKTRNMFNKSRIRFINYEFLEFQITDEESKSQG